MAETKDKQADERSRTAEERAAGGPEGRIPADAPEGGQAPQSGERKAARRAERDQESRGQQDDQVRRPGWDWLYATQVEHGVVTGLGADADTYEINDHLVEVPNTLTPHLLQIPLFHQHFYGRYVVPTPAYRYADQAEVERGARARKEREQADQQEDSQEDGALDARDRAGASPRRGAAGREAQEPEEEGPWALVHRLQAENAALHARMADLGHAQVEAGGPIATHSPAAARESAERISREITRIGQDPSAHPRPREEVEQAPPDVLAIQRAYTPAGSDAEQPNPYERGEPAHTPAERGQRKGQGSALTASEVSPPSRGEQPQPQSQKK